MTFSCHFHSTLSFLTKSLSTVSTLNLSYQLQVPNSLQIAY